jgi:hypothetical protein
MKRAIMTGGLSIGLIVISTGKCHAQIDIIGDILKRVIMAIDLRVQKMQTRTIILQSAQRELENVMEATHLSEITDWVQQQKDLYSEYYQELWQVKDALQYYSAVKQMIDKEAKLVVAYKQAYSALVNSGGLSVGEIAACVQEYQAIVRRSGATIDQLSTIIQAMTAQMTDADRLRMINDLSANIDRDYRQLYQVTQHAILLGLQRSKDVQDINLLKALYGIQ